MSTVPTAKGELDRALEGFLKVSRTIHEPARFGILEVLALRGDTAFRTLKDYLSLTDGNLASHLRKLEDEGHIRVRKRFVGRRPNTTYKITGKGLDSLKGYLKITLSALETMEKGLGRARVAL